MVNVICNGEEKCIAKCIKCANFYYIYFQAKVQVSKFSASSVALSSCVQLDIFSISLVEYKNSW